jgi:hypothetical protein
MRCGTFAVGSSDVNGFVVLVRMIENGIEPEAVSQSWLIGEVPDALVFGHLDVEVFQCFGVGHVYSFT